MISIWGVIIANIIGLLLIPQIASWDVKRLTKRKVDPQEEFIIICLWELAIFNIGVLIGIAVVLYG